MAVEISYEIQLALTTWLGSFVRTSSEGPDTPEKIVERMIGYVHTANEPEIVEIQFQVAEWVTAHPQFDFKTLVAELPLQNETVVRIFTEIRNRLSQLDRAELTRAAAERQNEIRAYMDWETYWRGLYHALEDIVEQAEPTQYVDLAPELIAERRRWIAENQSEPFINDLNNLSFAVTHPDFTWERAFAGYAVSREVILSHARKRIEQIKPLALERALLQPLQNAVLRSLIPVLVYSQPIPVSGLPTDTAVHFASVLQNLSADDRQALPAALEYVERNPEFKVTEIPPYPEVPETSLRQYVAVLRKYLASA